MRIVPPVPPHVERRHAADQKPLRARRSDDVRDLVPIPAGISPKLVGCVFRDLADAGILRRFGFRTSALPVAHARPLSVWRLADAASARLAARPTA